MANEISIRENAQGLYVVCRDGVPVEDGEFVYLTNACALREVLTHADPWRDLDTAIELQWSDND